MAAALTASTRAGRLTADRPGRLHPPTDKHTMTTDRPVSLADALAANAAKDAASHAGRPLR